MATNLQRQLCASKYRDQLFLCNFFLLLTFILLNSGQLSKDPPLPIKEMGKGTRESNILGLGFFFFKELAVHNPPPTPYDKS